MVPRASKSYVVLKVRCWMFRHSKCNMPHSTLVAGIKVLLNMLNHHEERESHSIKRVLDNYYEFVGWVQRSSNIKANNRGYFCPKTCLHLMIISTFYSWMAWFCKVADVIDKIRHVTPEVFIIVESQWWMSDYRYL